MQTAPGSLSPEECTKPVRSPAEGEKIMIYTITNNYAGSLQIKFDKKPVQAVIDYLKEQKMRWNWSLGVWFGAGDERAITSNTNHILI